MNRQLFTIESSPSEILLVYDAEKSSMPARDLGKAIIGLELCLSEVARTSLLFYEDIYIEPIEQGSIKTKLVFIKKNPFTIIVGIDLVANLFNNSFQLIDRFGANSFKNPQKEILEQISDRRILDLCRNFNFRDGLQQIAQPINELNQKAEIIISNKTLRITCDNKYQFYVDKQDEPILTELRNGEEVTIEGEITRINKKLNDLGFIYKGHTLNVSPLDKENSTSKFHEYLEQDKVKLRGIVIRDSDYEVPKIKVIEINSINNTQQKLPIGEN